MKEFQFDNVICILQIHSSSSDDSLMKKSLLSGTCHLKQPNCLITSTDAGISVQQGDVQPEQPLS
jgi:hypothetical protein